MTGRRRDLSLHLLDRQVVDTNGDAVGKVDDVEISEEGLVVALLTGPQALAGRLGGLLGSWLLFLSEGISRSSTAEPGRVGVELVTDYGTSITVARTREELGVHGNEDRAREYLIGRLPGADRARG
ncbi:MAG TPA: PRC-barrel domain-containing protein [Mycobacteriales bacterium]|nr:PRC-barrel domain-containing protein [Mycobacteriales bacterium]